MKFLLACWIALFAVPLAAAPVPDVAARAFSLIDLPTGSELAARQADLALPPASLTKMMTAYIVFSDIAARRLGLKDSVVVPESATRSDGARVFLTPGERVPVDTLLRAMLVASAADATLTLVTAVEKDETAFVARMNREAARLGLTRTRFANATGLSQAGHVSSARDLARLARALLRDFPAYQPYFAQQRLDFKGMSFYNANRLLWLDPSVDGIKTGRTPEAGYCIAASARRGDQRRIAVLLGAPSDAARSSGAQRLLEYGFEHYDSVLVYRANQPVRTLPLYRGTQNTIAAGFQQDFHLIVARGAAPRLKAQTVIESPVVAPVRRGQVLGRLRLTLDGRPVGEYPLVALQDVGVAGILGRGWDSIKLLFLK